MLYSGDGADDVKARTLVALLGQINKTPFSSTLCAEEQLGYMVKTTPDATEDTLVRFQVFIQSTRSTDDIEARITKFLDESLGKILRDLSDDEFAQHVQRLVSDLEQEPSFLGHEAQQHWASILDGYYAFDGRAADIAQLRATTKADLLDFYTRAIHSSSPTRRKLSVHIRPQALEPGTEGERVTDIVAFKDALVAAPRAPPARPLGVAST
ncbi:metalloprotease [Vanrija albida]|uniref:Metalloprotease n=1 Tax=Vanrija albida TaxID=181172 RepID=A0ABR3Q7T9_9TREE